jgi:membrane fusion protein (multidrug efflux system)
MSTNEIAAPPQPTPVAPPAPPASPPQASRPPSRILRRLAWAVVLLGLVGVAGWFAYEWVQYRRSHSITDDAFVEAHIVNIAPQSVSGHIVRFLVDENERVEPGQVVAEIDPVAYRDQVAVARAKLDTAEAELRRQQESLARLKIDVPLQIEVAKRSEAAARADRAKADEALKLTREEVARGIDEARAGLEASKADCTLAKQEYDRFTALAQQEAVPSRRADEVTRAYASAQAHVKLSEAKLAKALAEERKIEVSTRDVEVAVTTVEKAGKNVELAETGHDQIREVELLTVVKAKTVEEARRGLASAENMLAYTQVRAPVPGVVVKRYRHLGDFASPGVAILSMYNPDLTYVTANLEEDRLRGVAPGNPVELQVDAFAEPFRGRVVWIDKSTGAQFALMPRNVVSGEFTKVVQRVSVRIRIERDDRWPQLRAGLSVRAVIAHGEGDPRWAEQAAREMAEVEARYNQPRPDAPKAAPGDRP